MGSRTDSVAVKLIDNVSIAASGTHNSEELDVREVERLVVAITASGANVSVTPQVSLDGGSTWVNRATAYTAGATGHQSVIEMPGGTHFRVSANNAGAGSQSVTVWVVVQL